MIADPGSHSVRTFRDALGVAMWMADDYAFTNAALLLGPSGRILDVVRTDGIGPTIKPIIGWVTRQALGGDLPAESAEPVASVLLISVRPFDAAIVRESDLQLFRNASFTIARSGARLADWIDTDGDLFRSFAYTISPGTAWPEDPPLERRDAS